MIPLSSLQSALSHRQGLWRHPIIKSTPVSDSIPSTAISYFRRPCPKSPKPKSYKRFQRPLTVTTPISASHAFSLSGTRNKPNLSASGVFLVLPGWGRLMTCKHCVLSAILSLPPRPPPGRSTLYTGTRELCQRNRKTKVLVISETYQEHQTSNDILEKCLQKMEKCRKAKNITKIT